MSVGAQLSPSEASVLLTQQALALRNACQNIANTFTCVNALAGDTGLEAGFQAVGLGTSDATSAGNLLSYLNTVAGLYFGTAAQGSEFDFNNALAPLWAGQ